MSEWIKIVSSKIIENLLLRNSFDGYNYLKSQKKFIKKTKHIRKSLRLRFSSIYIENDIHLLVEPMWEIRYNYLHKWLEEFYQGSDLKTYRERFTHTFFYRAIDLLDKENEKGIIINLNKYKDFFIHLGEEIEMGFEKINQYAKLSTFYDLEVQKILDNKFDVLGISYFERLAVVKICNPRLLNTYIEKVRNYFKENADRGEVNALDYFPIFDEIIEKLHKTEFEQGNLYQK